MLHTPSHLIRSALPYRFLAARGLASFAFGAVALLWPSPGLAAAAGVFGLYLIVDSVITFAAARREWSARGLRNTWNFCMILIGATQLALGAVALSLVSSGAIPLNVVMGVWAFTVGMLEALSAILVERMRVRIPTPSRVYVELLGLSTFALSFALLIIPGWSPRGLLWALSIYALGAGAIYWDLARSAKLSARLATAIERGHAREEAA